ncbi:MocR-like pyridoxine biosynthesis transcription factor PdxR [Streptomyces poonensis]|uniref:GntR family transcriptional regulator n=1 Tax=Streptomyces poonensis TaxID=68255 RepID=A0A918PH10_9ACTN|nr:PLP-dependent aminotransferase family protein [Streptomyces poonensis]GGZ08691.1 GntR family transcriptional regulator [Streptomyces poonensis]GLJ90509.1 GntR family transcriptional regulator [Streptomyces poonensis]
MDVHVRLDGRRDLSGQIYRRLRAAIHDGLLRPGDPLPPTRELSRRLAVARNTVGVAYERLVAEGYADSRVGSGTYVRTTGLPTGLSPRGPATATDTTGSGLRPRALWADLTPWAAPKTTGATTAAHDLRVGLPDARLFPYHAWRPLIARELRHSAAGAVGYGDPAGHAGLRAALARHIGLSRGVRTCPDDVLVTTGTQQALDLIGRVLLEPGDRVAVEEPGYPPARLAFLAQGAEVTGVPVDAEGLLVDAIPPGTRAVYVTPAHQFPLGMPMSLRRRTALLRWARRHGAAVIEDDYDSEFRFGGRPVETLRNLDRDGHVIYVGSFSKVMLPSLRVGFLVAPAPLRTALRTAKYTADWHTAVPTQAALARFVDDGLLARHIRRMQHAYATRHQAVTRALTDLFADLAELVPSAAGLHVTAFTRGRLADPDALADRAVRARAAGVAVHTLAEVAANRSARPGFVFGYGSISAPDIEPGLHRVLGPPEDH